MIARQARTNAPWPPLKSQTRRLPPKIGIVGRKLARLGETEMREIAGMIVIAFLGWIHFAA